MMHAASRISSAVRMFFAPPEPFVSTLMGMPRFFACCSRLSAAMKVCAMPVGHAVTARIFFVIFAGAALVSGAASFASASVATGAESFAASNLPSSFASMSERNSSFDFAAIRASLKSGSMIIVASLLRTSRCTSASVAGAAISKKRREGFWSIASKSMPVGTVIAASPGSLTPALLACGVAMPSPSPVVPEASRASTSFSYCALSERLPPFSIRSVKRAMASFLSFGCAPSAMLSLFNKSVIRISTVPFFQPAFSRWSLKATRLRGAVRGFRKMPTQSLSRRP